MASVRCACVALSMVAMGLALLGPCTAQNSAIDYLHWHNYVRAQVGVPPLAWDTNLEAYAQNLANGLAGTCSLQHSNGPYGENLYMGDGDAIDVLRMWVNEQQYYDYNSNSCQAGEMCGHYTQVVWHSTQRVGCGRTACEVVSKMSQRYVVVCNYDPPGNWVGERPF